MTYRLLQRRLLSAARSLRAAATRFAKLDPELLAAVKAHAEKLADLATRAEQFRKFDPLPSGQARVLIYIRKYIEKHGFAPTRKEIADGMGFSSINAAQQHVEALAARGAITVGELEKRAIRVNKRMAG
jgi:hypothetical protein